MRKIKITEEQRQYALKEGLVIDVDSNATGGDDVKALEKAKQQAVNAGADPNKVTFKIPPKTNESRVITKRELIENRLKHFKENSKLYSVSGFTKKINEDLTNRQKRNILGITDDDELNAAAEAEEKEELEYTIWNALKEMTGGDPRKTTFSFADLCDMLNSKFGMKYVGSNDENECHEFSDGVNKLEIFPNVYYPEQGTLRFFNMHVY